MVHCSQSLVAQRAHNYWPTTSDHFLLRLCVADLSLNFVWEVFGNRWRDWDISQPSMRMSRTGRVYYYGETVMPYEEFAISEGGVVLTLDVCVCVCVCV